MQRTKNILMGEMLASIVFSVAAIVLFESDVLTVGVWTGKADLLFLTASVMELLTVSLIPMALYMFKMKKVNAWLTADGDEDKVAGRLLSLGSLRMAMLCVPMMLNTVFYYMFGLSVSFGYMAIIFFLCLFMVSPSMRRCFAETTKNVQ